jgi:hypothetical protein
MEGGPVDLAFTPDDVPADDPKARAAAARFRLSRVVSGDDPDFERAYALLDAEFGAKGELERHDALIGYFPRARGDAGYFLAVARDEDGTIAGVRDCHVSVDAQARVVVVFLSHVLVLSPYRRSGLGGVFRHLPVTLGRRAVASLPGGAGELLMAAEMEPWVAGASDTVTRLVAYGRAGYKIVAPQRLPYLQADYRAHDAIDADRLRPVPLLAVVRWVGHEGAR